MPINSMDDLKQSQLEVGELLDEMVALSKQKAEVQAAINHLQLRVNDIQAEQQDWLWRRYQERVGK